MIKITSIYAFQVKKKKDRLGKMTLNAFSSQFFISEQLK